MSRLRNIPGSREVIAASDFVIQDPAKQKGSWTEVFSHPAKPEIEIGMGKGRFLMDMAEKYPDRNFIGIELQSSVLFRAIQKAEIRALQREGVADAHSMPASVTEGRPGIWEGCNFRFILMDARLLGDVFAPHEVAGIRLNFSDPWPKERHGNRRLTSAGFLHMYQQILMEDGILTFKTDNRPLFDFSVEQVRQENWQITELTYDLHADPVLSADNVMTEYEEKFSRRGNPIFLLAAKPPLG